MYQFDSRPLMNAEELAALGIDFVAYVREISGSELDDLLAEGPELDPDRNYWALFAANGQPLMISDQPDEIMNDAFYNDLQPILPN